MNTTGLNIVMGLCAATVAIISFGNEIANNTSIKFAGKLWFKITGTVLAFFFGIWASVVKDNNSLVELHNYQMGAEQKQSLSDSINNEKIRLRDSQYNINDHKLQEKYSKELEESSNRNLATYTNVLAKYNLKYSESQDKIASLVKDSVRKEIPDFGVQVTQNAFSFKFNEKKDSLIGNLMIQNYGNCPIYVTAVAYFVFQTSNQTLEGPFKMAICSSENFSIGTGMTEPVRFGGVGTSGITNIFLLLKGNYSTLDYRIKRKINVIIQWSFEEGKWGTPRISVIEKVRNFLETNGVNN